MSFARAPQLDSKALFTKKGEVIKIIISITSPFFVKTRVEMIEPDGEQEAVCQKRNNLSLIIRLNSEILYDNNHWYSQRNLFLSLSVSLYLSLS